MVTLNIVFVCASWLVTWLEFSIVTMFWQGFYSNLAFFSLIFVFYEEFLSKSLHILHLYIFFDFLKSILEIFWYFLQMLQCMTSSVIITCTHTNQYCAIWTKGQNEQSKILTWSEAYWDKKQKKIIIHPTLIMRETKAGKNYQRSHCFLDIFQFKIM